MASQIEVTRNKRAEVLQKSIKLTDQAIEESSDLRVSEKKSHLQFKNELPSSPKKVPISLSNTGKNLEQFFLNQPLNQSIKQSEVQAFISKQDQSVSSGQYPIKIPEMKGVVDHLSIVNIGTESGAKSTFQGAASEFWSSKEEQ